MPTTECFDNISEGYRLKTIAMDTIITPDGRLPSGVSEVFGQRAKVVVLFDEQKPEPLSTNPVEGLMDLAGKINAFQQIEDPLEFQRKLRDEWAREWHE